MRIRLLPSHDWWLGAYLDRNRGELYMTLVPRLLLLLLSWGPSHDHGHMAHTGLVARRDRVTGDVEYLPRERAGDAWQPAHPVNYRHFRPGSPAPVEAQSDSSRPSKSSFFVDYPGTGNGL